MDSNKIVRKRNRRDQKIAGLTVGSAGHRRRSPQRVRQIPTVRNLRTGLVGGIIGLIITGLFTVVIMTVVIAALQGQSSHDSQLLNTAMTLTGSALGAVLGFFFGWRGSK